jgi:uncharacterized membrane protein YuzA (DUF378 family)
LHYLTFGLLVIGGLNWLLLALFDWELGKNLLGGMDSTASTIVYVLVGLSAIYESATHGWRCNHCAPKTVAPAANNSQM